MKANPGGTVTGAAILGRESEIAELWQKLEKRSVLLTAERRVGKTSVLRKMSENPREGWVPFFCLVESARHPIDCVAAIYSEADRQQVRSAKGVWLGRIRSAYRTLSGAEFAGWKLPSIRSDWKLLLQALVEDIAENATSRIVITLDEFPLMVWNITDDHGPAMGMEFLDTLRELRQKFEPTDRIRFLLSGSIGIHLILEHLKSAHGYKGNPTNDMALKVLTGMSWDDTDLMCRSYLDDEGIGRSNPLEVTNRMFRSTDGLPLYIQYVCERFQDARKREVCGEDIDLVLREMLDSREIEWFRNAAERIDTYYAKLGSDRHASSVLKLLCRADDFVPEEEIIDYLRSQITIEDDRVVLGTLELLLDDNYIIRDTSVGQRRYRFRYDIVRRWWGINRG